MKCKECNLFCELSNTKETGQGICSFPNSWTPTTEESDCMIKLPDRVCGNCSHFINNDTACMIAIAEDDASDCCGYVDKREDMVYNLLMDYKLQGINYRSHMESLMEDIDELPLPGKKDDIKVD